MPFPIPWKLVGIAAIFIFIGLTVYAGYTFVTDLQTENVQLQKDKQSLELANLGLEKELKEKERIKQDAIKEKDNALKSDIEARSALHEIEKKYADKERREREEAIEASKKASLYLKFIQNFEECVTQHFVDFDGKCNFLGQFKPKVVPK